ncbi:MAG: alkaline phosphatase family protein [Planctomycetota bacterium]
MVRNPLLLLALLAALAAVSCGPAPMDDPRDASVQDLLEKHPEAAKTRVMILGFDGADLDVIEPMVAAGELPNFKRAMTEGAVGRLRSEHPLLSPIIWTTIATGKSMDQHGILDFWAFNEKTGQMNSVSSVERKVEAVWDIAGRFGKKVGVVGWLATWPAEAVNGFVVSEKVGLLGYEYNRREDEPVKQAAHPPDLLDEIEPLIRKVGDVTFEEMDAYLNITEEEFRAKYERKPARGNLVNNHRLQYATAETFRHVGNSLWKEKSPDLMAWYFEYLDATCHLFMPYAPPRQDHISEADFARYRDAIGETYRWCDRVLGEAMAAADENTVIVVVSDHGFRSDRLRLRKPSDFHDREAVQWHRLFGTLMFWGKGVKPGTKLQAASIYDITPTVLGLMGFPAAADMDGEFIAAAFETPPPDDVVDTYSRGRRTVRIQMEGDTEADEINDARLEALGYVGPDQTVSGYLNLAGFLNRKGRFEEALAEYGKALDKQPESGRIHLAMAETYGLMRDAERSEKHLRTAIALDPGLHMARIHLAAALVRKNRRDEARKELETVLEDAPGMGIAWVALGRLNLGEKKVEEAEKCLRRAVEIDPDFTEGRIQLGIFLIKTGRYEEAETHCLEVIRLEPNHRIAWNNLGVIRMRRALKIEDPQRQEEALDLALSTFNDIIERFPDYPRGYGNRATIRIARRQFPLAIEDLKKALEIDPDYEEAKRNLQTLTSRIPGKPAK